MEDRIVRREVINASIDVHPSFPALIVDYDEVNIVLTSNGREMPMEPRQCSKARSKFIIVASGYYLRPKYIFLIFLFQILTLKILFFT